MPVPACLVPPLSLLFIALRVFFLLCRILPCPLQLFLSLVCPFPLFSSRLSVPKGSFLGVLNPSQFSLASPCLSLPTSKFSSFRSAVCIYTFLIPFYPALSYAAQPLHIPPRPTSFLLDPIIYVFSPGHFLCTPLCPTRLLPFLSC